MTGFGIGEAALGEGRVALELRALNHRFLEVRVRLPNEMADHASFLEQLARERLARGRFDVGARFVGAAIPTPRFSSERARAVYQSLLELRDLLAPGTEVPVSAVTALPDLVTTPTELDNDALQGALRLAFEIALERLGSMRDREGAALRREIELRLESCRRLLNSVRIRSSSLVETYRARLRDRVDRLLTGTAVAIEAGRLETELALLADKSDIREEIVRLNSHFDQFDEFLKVEGPVGRRLDFLLQEIGREANTIGAKSQDAPIAHLVVELKAEIERIREQVQNVE